MSQVSDSFLAAVRTLTADGSSKERLAHAYSEHLEAVRADDLPDSLRPRFEHLQAAMASVRPNARETAVQVSVRKMSQAEASRHVRTIVGIFSDLLRAATTSSETTAEPRETGKPAGAPYARIEKGRRVPRFLSNS